MNKTITADELKLLGEEYDKSKRALILENLKLENLDNGFLDQIKLGDMLEGLLLQQAIQKLFINNITKGSSADGKVITSTRQLIVTANKK